MTSVRKRRLEEVEANIGKAFSWPGGRVVAGDDIVPPAM
jgi:hypothetical protein